MKRLAILITLLPSIALAQIIYPPSAVDTSTLATKSEVAAADGKATTAQQAAAAAQSKADAACIPMPTVPPVEVPGGTAGSGQNCRLINAADNRISRTGQFTYNAAGAILCGGSTTCTWSTPLPTGAASYPVFFTPIGASATPSVKCKVASSTNTGFTGANCAAANVGIVLGGSADVTVGLTPGQVFILSLPSTQANQ